MAGPDVPEVPEFDIRTLSVTTVWQRGDGVVGVVFSDGRGFTFDEDVARDLGQRLREFFGEAV